MITNFIMEIKCKKSILVIMIFLMQFQLQYLLLLSDVKNAHGDAYEAYKKQNQKYSIQVAEIKALKKKVFEQSYIMKSMDKANRRNRDFSLLQVLKNSSLIIRNVHLDKDVFYVSAEGNFQEFFELLRICSQSSSFAIRNFLAQKSDSQQSLSLLLNLVTI